MTGLIAALLFVVLRTGAAADLLVPGIGTLAVPVIPGLDKGPTPAEGMIGFETIADWPGDAGRSFAFISSNGSALLLLSPFWLNSVELSDEELRRSVERSSVSVRDRADETEFPLHQIGGDQVRGYYYAATDRDSRSDAKRHLYQGLMRVGPMPVAFTVLNSDGAEPTAKSALDSLGRLRLMR